MKRSYYELNQDNIATQTMADYEPIKGDQGSGYRMRFSKRKAVGNPMFRPMKALNTGLQRVSLVFNTLTTGGGATPFKHLVSEFDPTRGGFVSIPKKTGTASSIDDEFGRLPMHCFDLNFFPGNNRTDTLANFVPQATNQCNDINARHWIMANNLTWNGTNENKNTRWVIDNPDTTNLGSVQNPYIYRNYIDLKFMLYGCTKNATKFDIRVIQITDPRYCPDYPMNLANTADTPDGDDVNMGWQNLLTPFTVNPLLTGEPGPKPGKRWFKTIAKKVVHIGEQTGEIETIPCVQTSMRVNINRAFNYAWTNRDFAQEGANFLNDGGLTGANDTNANSRFAHKPYYTQRYYLLIRALCPLDTASSTAFNQDDGTDDPAELRLTRPYDDKGHTATQCRYIPTYDLVVRNVFTVAKN